MNALKGFKTIAFNVIMVGVMLARAINPEAELPDEAAVQTAVVSMDTGLIALWGIVNGWLRAVTNSPVFKKI